MRKHSTRNSFWNIFFENSEITEESRVILNETKIIVMSIGNTKFIDSVNYLPMRISDLPKTFRLKDTLGKDVFPHLFNTKTNQMYISPIPDIITILFYRSNEARKNMNGLRNGTRKRSNFIFNFQQFSEIVKLP